MRQDKLSKGNLVLYALGILPVVWLGVLIAPSLHGGLPEIMEGLSKAMAKPFSLMWCDTTVKTVLILLGAYVLAILIYVTSQRNYRPREEHGSAKWGKTAQLRKYRNKEKPEDAKILTQDTSISLKGRSHRHNLNVVVVGGSGAGKTRFYAKPNVLQANCSMVILDPNGKEVLGYILQAVH